MSQMREVDAGIICTSYSNPVGHIGIFSDKAALVDAFTRATKQLVIIGDITVLKYFLF